MKMNSLVQLAALTIFSAFQYVPFVVAVLSKDRKMYHSMVAFAGHYIHRDNNDQNEYNRICSEQIDATMRSFIFRMGLLSISGLCATGGPMYAYISEGIRTSTVEVKIPYFEENSDVEYSLNMIFQSILLAHGFFIYITIETTMSLIKDFVKVTPNLINYRIKESIEVYGEKKISKLQLRYIFKDITKQLVDYEE